ncbi:MAG: hypothetical protein KAU60_06035, partial [Desulfobacterales bacterium]|nr:hypothetical protein [Desulfobacterales bacterium]
SSKKCLTQRRKDAKVLFNFLTGFTGYSGLKHQSSVSVQWFTVSRSHAPALEQGQMCQVLSI